MDVMGRYIRLANQQQVRFAIKNSQFYHHTASIVPSYYVRIMLLIEKQLMHNNGVLKLSNRNQNEPLNGGSFLVFTEFIIRNQINRMVHLVAVLGVLQQHCGNDIQFIGNGKLGVNKARVVHKFAVFD
ncbi:hypothetical protein S101258_00115 [Lactiplantibacillus plantarum subsp. plantarum]|uniref:Uncharacterized protein n=1 Tax=Lactiplantibacillus plantarum subsp. plantarum TaxID=337330 RepID=A0A2S3UAM4_LACPN|nr:hypothetical protein S101258_00115 [Lactiplantibacillus plantarum subsp. plantarum]